MKNNLLAKESSQSISQINRTKTNNKPNSLTVDSTRNYSSFFKSADIDRFKIIEEKLDNISNDLGTFKPDLAKVISTVEELKIELEKSHTFFEEKIDEKIDENNVKVISCLLAIVKNLSKNSWAFNEATYEFASSQLSHNLGINIEEFTGSNLFNVPKSNKILKTNIEKHQMDKKRAIKRKLRLSEEHTNSQKKLNNCSIE